MTPSARLEALIREAISLGCTESRLGSTRLLVVPEPEADETILDGPDDADIRRRVEDAFAELRGAR